MIDYLLTWRDRVRCRLWSIHGPACRGRQDHTLPGGGIVDPERWRP